MINVEINLDGEINNYVFPSSWLEVNVETYKNIHKLEKPTDEEDLMYVFDIINVLSGIDKNILYQMDINQFRLITEQLSFIYSPVEAVSVETIELEGGTYYLYTNFDKYSAGEIISIDTILRQHNYDYISCMTDLLCVFLRKKVDGKIEPFNTDLLSRKILFNKLKISEVNNLFSFFLTGSNMSAKTSKDYTNAEPPIMKVSSTND